jgi:hypothetical protein
MHCIASACYAIDASTGETGEDIGGDLLRNNRIAMGACGSSVLRFER